MTGIHRPRVAQCADQPPRQRADVGAAVATDFGLVAHAAERHADELPPSGTRDRFADGRLAGSRRSDQRQDRARSPVVGEAALGAELAHRQVFGDAALHVLQAGVFGVQHLAGVARIEPLVRTLRPRDREQPVEIGADHRRLGVRIADPLEARQLALGLRLHRVRHAGGGDLLAVFLGDRAFVLAQFLANRVHLLPQEVVPLLLLGARFDVLPDALPHLQLGQPLLLQAQRQRQPLDDVERLQQFDLLCVVEVWRIAGGIGQRARLGDRAHERADAAVVAAQLEDLLDHRAVLALEILGLHGRRGHVRPLVDLDAQHAVAIFVRRAGDRAVQRDQRRDAAVPALAG